jgi:hypothetical protein
MSRIKTYYHEERRDGSTISEQKKRIAKYYGADLRSIRTEKHKTREGATRYIVCVVLS